jgi:hypothetical protein
LSLSGEVCMTEHTGATERRITGFGKTLIHERYRDYGRLITLGTAAASIAAVIELATLRELDGSLTFAVYCFALAIPVTTTVGLMVHPDSGVESAALGRTLLALYVIGVVVAFAGFVSLFGHFSSTLGVIFFVSAVVAVMVSAYATGAVQEVSDVFAKRS